MGHLLAQIRRWISSETVPLPVAISDMTIQDVLDQHRTDIVQLAMTPIPSVLPGGAMRYYEHRVPWEWWEDTAVIQGRAWEILTPVSADLLRGVWTFGESQDYLYITGSSYDCYGAAADLLELQMVSQGVLVNSQKVASHIERQISVYRQKQRPLRVELYRTDVTRHS